METPTMTPSVTNNTGAVLSLRMANGVVKMIPVGAMTPMETNANHELSTTPLAPGSTPPVPAMAAANTTVANVGTMNLMMTAVPPGVTPNITLVAGGPPAVVGSVQYNVTT